jgi:hypothetical protein
VRSLQRILLFIGATALGSAWGCIAIALLGAFTIFRARSGEDWGTAFGAIFSGACFGLPLGGLAGIGAARVIASDESDDWGPFVWIGVAVGVSLGLASCYFGVSNLRFDVVGALIAVIATAMFGAIGGMLAAIGEGLWRRTRRGTSRLAAIGLAALCAFVAISMLCVLARMQFNKQLTGVQIALTLLIGAPILCGSTIWLRNGQRRQPGRSRNTR